MRYDEGGNRLRLARLSDRGVKIWGAEQVWIAEDVRLDRIEPGAEIYQAVLSGSSLFIGSGSRIGVSGSARISDCQIGRDCEIGAGTFDGATFLDGATIRGFAEVRAGTVMEEQTEAAHSVAFKNTILTATTITGSLINYCDIFMSGGTSRDNHSEVGSGAIHFNFDPRGDKWGSLAGDATGVLLRKPPVFVGGNVGLVGPLSIAHGAVIAAGSIVRRDVPQGCIYSESSPNGVLVKEGFQRTKYGSLRRKLLTTSRLAGNYIALWNWYGGVRGSCAAEHEELLYASAQRQIERNLGERAKRIGKLIAKLPTSLQDTTSEALRQEHEMLLDRRDAILAALNPHERASAAPTRVVEAYRSERRTSGHVDAVKGLSAAIAEEAENWLGGLAESVERRMEELINS